MIAFSILANRTEQEIHDRALVRAKKYLAAEAELLESIIEIDRHRIFEKFGEAFITPYCVKYFALSEDVAANFVRVASKSKEVPELKLAITEGALSVTKAKLITSVITSENRSEWISKAATLSKHKLEFEIAAANPKLTKPEKAKPVASDRVRVEFELGKEEMELFRRAQDLIS